MPEFPVTYTTLSAAALRPWLARRYELGAVEGVEFFHRGLNDAYLVDAAAGRFVLRVYRHGWRSAGEITYELAALRHLAERGVRVAAPVADRDGKLAATLPAPEGERFAVLFAFAPGVELADRIEDSEAYGAAAAAIHAASDDFACAAPRRPLDLAYLLEDALVAIRPMLAGRPEDRRALDDLAACLARRIETVAPALERGFCHGDFHGDNAHIADGRVTFFDFDCCGPGWRAYDVAVFRWRWGEEERGAAHWAAFLAGYRAARPLAEADLAAAPLFVALRTIWIRGLHSANSADWGRSWLNQRYWDRFFKQLREWRARQSEA